MSHSVLKNNDILFILQTLRHLKIDKINSESEHIEQK